MKKVKIIILVLSYDDNGGVYDTFQKAQSETWDKELYPDIETFFFYGDSNENKIIGKKIYVTVDSGLWSCGLKTIESLKLINSNFDYDFLFRTNSSSYVDKQLLSDFLYDKPKKNYYAGHSAHDQGVNYVSGSGIILSKDLVDIIIENQNQVDSGLMDDASFAKILNSRGTYPTQVDRCNYSDGIVNNLDCKSFLYRLKSNNREFDIRNMYQIYNLKNKN